MTPNLGYVFTRRPLNLNEKLVIQIMKTDQLFDGNLGFGLTTCNPSNLTTHDLPEDSHKLLDRHEYWVVIKDVLLNAKAGDELSFKINDLNQVQLTKNDLPPVTLMHVDASQSFYAFFDLHGKTTKIQILGTYYEQASVQQIKFVNQPSQLTNGSLIKPISMQRRIQSSSPKLTNNHNQQIQLMVADKSSNLNPENGISSNECTVCFEKQINCVLYQCGHMCMCYDCAMRQWQGMGNGQGQCPICRAYICDVIRTYWS